MSENELSPEENAEIVRNFLPAKVTPQPLAVAEPQAMTPAQARVQEVSEALRPAYEKASTLELTDAEIAGLMEPFPDDVIDIRPHDGLIYISHIHISDRLNRIFKPGKWALISRREWVEGSTAYGQYVLMIRGCYIGESFGGHPYVASNPKTNWADAMEATQGEALRRIAGKRLSCGSQVWSKTYADNWIAKYAVQRNGKWYKKAADSPPVSPSAPKPAQAPTRPAPAPPPKPAEPAPRVPTAATKAWFLRQLPDAAKEMATNYFIEVGALLPTEALSDLPLANVPTSKDELKAVLGAIEHFAETGEAAAAFPPHRDAPITAPKEQAKEPEGGKPEDAEDAPWRSFVIPFGKMAGKTLAEVDKKFLYGFWAGYTVETEWNGKPKKPETIAKDRAFRAALDEAGKHYEFTKPEDKE